jgi:hypothetical protein
MAGTGRSVIERWTVWGTAVGVVEALSRDGDAAVTSETTLSVNGIMGDVSVSRSMSVDASAGGTASYAGTESGAVKATSGALSSVVTNGSANSGET